MSNAKIKQAIDPKTTRRTVSAEKYQRNSALFATYEVLQRDRDSVVLQRKAEFCVRH